jgi:hypothetical protein
MDLSTLLKAVDTLSPDELEQLRRHVLELEAEGWDQALEAAAIAFRGDSTDEEMVEIVAAMNMKSSPSKSTIGG